MESNLPRTTLQILHFNDAYELESTPKFAFDYLKRQKMFLHPTAGNTVSGTEILKQQMDFDYSHTVTGQHDDTPNR